MSENPVPFFQKIKRSLTAKIIILGFIILVLMIPYFMAVNLRRDRMRRSEKAEREVSGKWGGVQLVTAPVLRIPVQQVRTVKEGQKTFFNTCCILPDTLKIQSSLQPEMRYRGIYPVMLYRSQIKINAEFRMPLELPVSDWKPVPGQETKMLFRVSDVKGIEKLSIQLNGQSLKPVPGAIITVPVKPEWQNGKKLTVSAELALNGCRTLLFSPAGRIFELNISSPWAHPSFTGGFLPRTRTVSEKGFQAQWIVNELNKSFSQSWLGDLNQQLPGISPTLSRYRTEENSSKELGVSLVQPAGTYQQVERVSDYAFLVIAIVLIAFLIGEMVTKIWIHPLQYFFAGLSLMTFYVLLLALAEHLSFNLSYLLSTVVIAGMTTLYCCRIFAERKAAALLLGGIMLLAYLLVFVLIRLEDYALLAGSCVLVVLLGILMRVTGHMNREEKS